MEAAGVDSLWLDEAGLRALAVLAAIAAVTGRARLVAPVEGRPPASPGARVETLARLSRGRVALTVTGCRRIRTASSGDRGRASRPVLRDPPGCE